MHYLHTMVRVRDLDESLDFYCNKLGMVEFGRRSDEKGRYTNVFLIAPGDSVASDTFAEKTGRAPTGKGGPMLELTYNWDPEAYTGGRNFGHLAYAVENIYDFCEQRQKEGIIINRPPRDGRMAFIRSPDGISIELLQIGDPLPLQEPWQSMPSTGDW